MKDANNELTLKWTNEPAGPETCLRTLGGHWGGIEGLALSPDGKTLVFSAADQTVRIWDVPSAIERMVFGTPAVESEFSGLALVPRPLQVYRGPMAVSADFHRVYSARNSGSVDVLDPLGQGKITSLSGGPSIIQALALTPDGARLVSGSQNGDLGIWDVQSKALLRSWHAHNMPVSGLAIAADGGRLYSGGLDQKVKVWDLEEGMELLTVGKVDMGEMAAFFGTLAKQQGISAWINSLAVSPEGRTVFVADGVSAEIKMWDGLTGRRLELLKGHRSWTNAMGVSPDSSLLATANNDRTIKIWDLETYQVAATLVGHASGVSSVVWSSDGKWVLSGGSDGTIKIWDVRTARGPAGKGDLERHASDVVLFSDGRRAASVGWTNAVWETASGRKLSDLTPESEPIMAAASPDGRRLIWSNDNTVIDIWNPETGDKPIQLMGYLGPITAMAISPDGRKVVGGSAENYLKIWEMETGLELRMLSWFTDSEKKKIADKPLSPLEKMMTMLEPREGITDIKISPSGELIIASGRDGAVKVWNMEDGKRTAVLSGHSSAVTALAISPDGRYCFSGGNDGLIVMWDLRKFEKKALLASPKSLGEPAFSDMFSGTGRNIQSLMATPDGKYLLWNTKSGSVFRSAPLEAGEQKPLGQLGLDSAIAPARSRTALCVTPDGKIAIGGSSDGRLLCWDVETGQLAHVFQARAGIRSVVAWGSMILARDETGLFYFLGFPDGFLGPPHVTALRIARGIQYRCPNCFKNNDAEKSRLGTETNCGQCGKPVRISAFLAMEGKKSGWKFW
jgi:WD40 repeat protein